MTEYQRPPIVVVSNRGPYDFHLDDQGRPQPVRGGGGLVTCLAPAAKDAGAIWLSPTATDADRVAAEEGMIDAGGFQLKPVAVEAEMYRRYYDVIANGTLWFLHHNLFDLARRPRMDQHWWTAWHAYKQVNEIMANAVAEVAPPNSTVLVHDYHLTLLGQHLRQVRPDVKSVHFHHTPFVDRNTIDVLPPTVAQALLEGLAGHDACGFHSQRWADNFALCCADSLSTVPATFVSAAAPNVEELLQLASSPECAASEERLNKQVGDRKLIVRVDRIELSKNLLRGFHAYDDLLRRFPRWRNKVTFVAYVYPSRQGLAEYLAYRNEVQGLVDYVNQEWGTEDWQPIVCEIGDDLPRAMAGLRRYDALLVNPIRDGLNLVAKEGALVNQQNGAIILSRAAGAWQELSKGAIGINPFDITGTADALLHALEMPEEERLARAKSVHDAANLRRPHHWLADQLAAVQLAK